MKIGYARSLHDGCSIKLQSALPGALGKAHFNQIEHGKFIAVAGPLGFFSKAGAYLKKTAFFLIQPAEILHYTVKIRRKHWPQTLFVVEPKNLFERRMFRINRHFFKGFDSLVFTPELVVYADDLIYQSRMFASGFSLADDEVGLSAISTIGPGGNFLMAKLTGKYFRRSQFTTKIWPFLTLDKWRGRGQPKAEKILKDKTCQMLNDLVFPADKNDILAKGKVFLGR